MTKNTESIREQYIAHRFELNGVIESTVDVNNLSDEFVKSSIDFAAWYDSKYEETQDLIDEIADKTSFILQVDAYDSFIEELEPYLIADAIDFQDKFIKELEGTGKEVMAEFVEWYMGECGYEIEPPIDWTLVWKNQLQPRHFAVEFNGNTYFFKND